VSLAADVSPADAPRPAEAGGGRLAALDGWRAISVGLVIFSHLASDSSLAVHPTGALGAQLIGPLLSEAGSLGVHVFFVISGYVIVRGLIGEQQRAGRISMSGFYVRRIFRIVPPLASYVLAIVALAAFHLLPASAFGTLQALTFTCNMAPCGGWWGGHTWSLAYEEQFYIVTPALFLATAARGRARTFFWFLVALCAAPVLIAPVSEAPAQFLAPFIAIAMGVAWACADGWVLGVVRRIPTVAVIPALALLVVAERLEYTRLAPLAAIAAPVLIAYALAATCLASPWAARWLSGRLITFLGRISYGIYLWQQLATAPYAGAGALFYVASVGACIGWAAISFRWFETPLTNAGRRISRRLAAGAVSARPTRNADLSTP
jgi:peptidoglycan/LPS O-acetylase OafA/YrhL